MKNERKALIDLLHWWVNEDENITYRMTIDEAVDYYLKSINEHTGETRTLEENKDKRRVCDRYNHRCDEAFDNGKNCTTCVYFGEL